MPRRPFASLLIAALFAVTAAAAAGCNDRPDGRSGYEQQREDVLRDRQYP